MHPEQLRRAIRETLTHPKFTVRYSQAAENLLFMTAAHESDCGKYIWQMGGPAMGVFQMEPATLDDLYLNYLRFKPHHRDSLEYWRPQFGNPVDGLWGCLLYQVASARLQYYRKPFAMPDADDIEALAHIAKDEWNTVVGKATWRNYADAYRRYSRKEYP